MTDVDDILLRAEPALFRVGQSVRFDNPTVAAISPVYRSVQRKVGTIVDIRKHDNKILMFSFPYVVEFPGGITLPCGEHEIFGVAFGPLEK